MLASRINANNGNGGGESTMPGDYEQWSGAASRMAPPRTAPSPPPRPSIPQRSRSNQRPPQVSPAAGPITRPSVTLAHSPVRSRRPRRRSLTPDIVIDRRHRHHTSSGRHRVITIPLDNLPTLGLRGPPKRVLEIERVRCRRHRRARSSYYEPDDYMPPPPPQQPQSNVLATNPYLSPAQPSLMVSPNNSAASLAFISNLTPEMIENLPRRTVHLPPIYLPGSQADANTELHTVVFPAELINPIDGTLSIIQRDPTINYGGFPNIQPPVAISAQPPLINAPAHVESPLASLAMLSGPFMQQVQDLFRRITLSATQSPLSSYNHANIQPPLPATSQYNATPNSLYNPQTIPSISTKNTGSYPSANIRPTNTLIDEPYNTTTTFTPTSRANIRPYRPANITPYQIASNTPSNTRNITSYTPANNTPYSPANITPYQTTTNTPSNSRNIMPYNLANITPYHSPGLAQSSPKSTRPNLPNIAPSNLAESGPYRPANITPFSATPNRFAGNSTLTPYVSSSSLTSSDSYNFFPSGIDNRPENVPYSSQTPYQSGNPMPKSILRNAPSNTTYTRSNLSSISSPNDIVRKTATFA
jgi:hypothetical protein